MILSFVRGGFIVLVVVVTFLALIRAGEGQTTAFEDSFGARWYVPVGLGLILATIFVAVDIFTPRKKISSIVGITFGLLGGLMISFALGFVIDLVVETWGLADASDEIGARVVGTLKLLIAISLCYVGITTVLQTKDEFRLVIPYVEFAKQIRGARPLITDTSALIDARLLDLAGTGVLQAPILIPRFVINELQTLADSGDRLKRQRGRRGLDIIAKLQRQPTLDVSIDDTPMPGKAVDQMLVDLARQMPGIILTTDSGLCRIARIQSVTAVNINDLGAALKPSLIPGERVRFEISKQGEQPGQGVGYLPDGTMVVVEQGQHAVGTIAEVEITGSIQTASGRMLFGKLDGADEQDHRPTGPQERPGQASIGTSATDSARADNSGGNTGAGGTNAPGSGDPEARQTGPVGDSGPAVTDGSAAGQAPDAGASEKPEAESNPRTPRPRNPRPSSRSRNPRR